MRIQILVGVLCFLLGVAAMTLIKSGGADSILLETSRIVEGAPAAQEQAAEEFALPVSEVDLLHGEPLLERLREGGLVLYFRHFHTDHSVWHVDPVKARHAEMKDLAVWATCKEQRRLSDYGRRLASDVGAAMSTLGVPIGRGVSSPYCRAVASLEGVLGRAPDEITLDLLHRGGELKTAEMTRKLIPLLTAVPEGGANTVLVAHRPQMDSIAEISEGQTYVFEPLPEGRLRWIGSIFAFEWLLATQDPSYLGLGPAEGGAFK